MSTPPRLYTVAEAGRILRLDPKSVTRNLQAGRLAGIRLPSGHWRAYADDVDAIVARPESA